MSNGPVMKEAQAQEPKDYSGYLRVRKTVLDAIVAIEADFEAKKEVVDKPTIFWDRAQVKKLLETLIALDEKVKPYNGGKAFINIEVKKGAGLDYEKTFHKLNDWIGMPKTKPLDADAIKLLKERLSTISRLIDSDKMKVALGVEGKPSPPSTKPTPAPVPVPTPDLLKQHEDRLNELDYIAGSPHSTKEDRAMAGRLAKMIRDRKGRVSPTTVQSIDTFKRAAKGRTDAEKERAEKAVAAKPPAPKPKPIPPSETPQERLTREHQDRLRNLDLFTRHSNRRVAAKAKAYKAALEREIRAANVTDGTVTFVDRFIADVSRLDGEAAASASVAAVQARPSAKPIADQVKELLEKLKARPDGPAKSEIHSFLTNDLWLLGETPAAMVVAHLRAAEEALPDQTKADQEIDKAKELKKAEQRFYAKLLGLAVNIAKKSEEHILASGLPTRKELQDAEKRDSVGSFGRGDARKEGYYYALSKRGSYNGREDMAERMGERRTDAEKYLGANYDASDETKQKLNYHYIKDLLHAMSVHDDAISTFISLWDYAKANGLDTMSDDRKRKSLWKEYAVGAATLADPATTAKEEEYKPFDHFERDPGRYTPERKQRLLKQYAQAHGMQNASEEEVKKSLLYAMEWKYNDIMLGMISEVAIHAPALSGDVASAVDRISQLEALRVTLERDFTDVTNKKDMYHTYGTYSAKSSQGLDTAELTAEEKTKIEGYMLEDARHALAQAISLSGLSATNDPVVMTASRNIQHYRTVAPEDQAAVAKRFYEMAMDISAIANLVTWISTPDMHRPSADVALARRMLAEARKAFAHDFKEPVVAMTCYPQRSRLFADAGVNVLAPQANTVVDAVRRYDIETTADLMEGTALQALVSAAAPAAAKAKQEADAKPGNEPRSLEAHLNEQMGVDAKREAILSDRDRLFKRGAKYSKKYLQLLVALKDNDGFAVPAGQASEPEWRRALLMIHPLVGRDRLVASGADIDGSTVLPSIDEMRERITVDRLDKEENEIPGKGAKKREKIAVYPHGDVYAEGYRQSILHVDPTVDPLLTQLNADSYKEQAVAVSLGYNAESATPVSQFAAGDSVHIMLRNQRITDLTRRLAGKHLYTITDIKGKTYRFTWEQLMRRGAKDPKIWYLQRTHEMEESARALSTWFGPQTSPLLRVGLGRRLTIMTAEAGVDSTSPRNEFGGACRGIECEPWIITPGVEFRAGMEADISFKSGREGQDYALLEAPIIVRTIEGKEFSLRDFEKREKRRQNIDFYWVVFREISGSRESPEWMLQNPLWDPTTEEGRKQPEFIGKVIMIQYPGEKDPTPAVVRVKKPTAEATLTTEWEEERGAKGGVKVMFRLKQGEDGTIYLEPPLKALEDKKLRDEICFTSQRPVKLVPTVSQDVKAVVIAHPNE